MQSVIPSKGTNKEHIVVIMTETLKTFLDNEEDIYLIQQQNLAVDNMLQTGNSGHVF